MARINRKTLPKWQKKLSAAEIRHMRECGVNTREAFKRNTAFQKKTEKEDGRVACHECKFIAVKLGMWDD